MTDAINKSLTLLTHPRMAVKYARWLVATLTGRECAASLLGGGTITGFRRFTDYWSLNSPSQAEYNLLRRVVRPGEAVADIGANVGAFTVTMGRLGTREGTSPARVFAFEPSPTTVQQLRANVSQNRLANVEVIQAAVADALGHVHLTDDPICPARNHLTAAPTENGNPTVGVDAITLDQFCADRSIERLGFVKSDTEGAETRVLRGANRLLREKRIGCALIEVCAPYLIEMGSSVRELFETIESCGYAAFQLMPDGVAGNRLSAADLKSEMFANVLLQAK